MTFTSNISINADSGVPGVNKERSLVSAGDSDRVVQVEPVDVAVRVRVDLEVKLEWPQLEEHVCDDDAGACCRGDFCSCFGDHSDARKQLHTIL